MEDVKEQAEATAVESSIDETNTQDQTQEATETAPVADLESKSIPYDRFREVNEELKGTRGTVQELQRKVQEFEQRMNPAQPVSPEIEQAKRALKDLGYAPLDEVRQEFQKTLAQERLNQQTEQKLSSLESKYNGKDGQPKFDRQQVVNFMLKDPSMPIGDPEIAYKTLHEKEIIDWHIRQATAKSGGVKSEASDGSGSAQAAGTTNDDLKQAAIAGDESARRLFIKRLLG